MENPRIFGLDLARAFAISLVVLAHLNQGTHEVGIYGVELFFALSGFLIGTILHRNVPREGAWTAARMLNFWQRRWWRTLPAYYLFLLVAVAHHGFRGELPEGGWAGLAPYLVFAPNLMSPNEVFYDISWSLCVEEAFYLVFPLLIYAAQAVARSRAVSFAAALAFLVVLGAVLREVAFASWPSDQVRVMTLPRIDAVGYGVMMAVVARTRVLTPPVRAALAGVGGALICAVAACHLALRPLTDDVWFFRIGLVTMPVAFSLCMPLLAEWRELPRPLAGLRGPVTAISLWSYSIYLCHHMVLMAIYPLFGECREHFAVKLLSKAVGLVVILVLSRFVYRCFESPLTRRRPPEMPAMG